MAAQAAPPPLRALVVTIVAQGGFLEWLVEQAVAAGTVTPLALDVAHVRELDQRLAEGSYDLVIAHAHARPAQRLAVRGVLAAGTPVFANPRAIIGPADDPAGLRGAASLDDALTRLAAHGGCWVHHAHGGLVDLQPAADATDRCVLVPAATGPGGALAAAREHGAYTLWGYHPFSRRAAPGLAAIVTGDARLLATLLAWPVATTPRREEVDELIALLASPAIQQRLATFRLAGDPANQAWWPASAAAAVTPAP